MLAAVNRRDMAGMDDGMLLTLRYSSSPRVDLVVLLLLNTICEIV